jgi:allantoicase
LARHIDATARLSDFDRARRVARSDDQETPSMEQPPNEPAAFPGLIDLAAERVGGKALIASDEFFAAKENLLKPGRGVFMPGEYTDRGKWMDGWESRRKRTPGHDWCVIRLGLAGVIEAFDVDTHHFLGNHPPYASIEASAAPPETPAERLASDQARWMEILPRSPLKPGSQNLFAISSRERWSHLRLNIHPDGGVARLRAYGRVMPDWSRIKPGESIDLAAVEHGGIVVAASDMFFGSKENLIMPGRAANMGDGWETRRRRGPGHDWAVVKLGRAGTIAKVEVDTNHFKGNYPDRCSIDVCNEPERAVDALTAGEIAWRELLPETRLEAHQQHFFEKELRASGNATHVRLNIYPDGGVSRLRVYGEIAPLSG